MQPLKQFDFTPILGWSISRYDLFSICKRQYFYTYYAKYDQEFPRSRIDRLKNFTTIPLETGNIVHDTIKVLLERLLRSEKEINKKRFFDYAKRKTEDYCKSKTFSEIYYKELKDVNPNEIFRSVSNALNNFLESPRYDWIKSKAISNKQNWLIEPPGYGETRIDGQKAYCKVDFLFPVEDKIFVLDWKTGKPIESKHKKQLVAYCCWASYHFQKDPVEIIPIIAYLYPEYSEMQFSVNEFDIEDLIIKVKDETEEMYSFCQDLEENVPKEKETFYKTKKTLICRYCNFRELCDL